MSENVTRTMNREMLKPCVVTRQSELHLSVASSPPPSFSYDNTAGTVRVSLCLTTMRLLLLTVMVCAFLTTGDCLEFLGLEVPSVVDPRWEKVILRCEYDLGNEELYSVKWYKDGDEFYTFMPSWMPPGREYDVEGVKVDVGRSDSKQVILLGQTRSPKKKINYAGRYGCEVSVEAPSYSTAFGSANMTVAVLPHQNPSFDNKPTTHYDIGDILEVNCTSALSYPPAVLSFLLNHKEVDKLLTMHLPSFGPVEGNVVSSTRLGINITLEREHFPGGNLSLICRSRLPGIPGAEIRSTEAIVTLAASNQRLAQEPPKAGASRASIDLIFLQIFILATTLLRPIFSIMV